MDTTIDQAAGDSEYNEILTIEEKLTVEDCESIEIQKKQ